MYYPIKKISGHVRRFSTKYQLIYRSISILNSKSKQVNSIINTTYNANQQYT